jgi:hypothetical protein
VAFAANGKRRLYDALFLVGALVCRAGVEETLQDEYGGDLVNDVAPFSRLVAGRVQTENPSHIHRLSFCCLIRNGTMAQIAS